MASSTRSTAPEKSSATTSRASTPTSTSSRTRSTSSTDGAAGFSPPDVGGLKAAAPHTVVIALGSNLGDRRYNLLRAVHAIREVVRVVRVSSILETEPVDAPPDSPRFLNMVLTGFTSSTPESLLDALLDIESRHGRVRRGVRNEPRVIDIDLIAHSANRRKTKRLQLPHPRYQERSFVMEPLREISVFRGLRRLPR